MEPSLPFGFKREVFYRVKISRISQQISSHPIHENCLPKICMDKWISIELFRFGIDEKDSQEVYLVGVLEIVV